MAPPPAAAAERARQVPDAVNRQEPNAGARKEPSDARAEMAQPRSQKPTKYLTFLRLQEARCNFKASVWAGAHALGVKPQLLAGATCLTASL